jgi:hypothetical protein
MQRRQILQLAAVIAGSFAAIQAASCSGGSPSNPTPTSPTPTPTPAAGGTSGQSCRLGPGSTTATCGKQSSRLTDYVMAAMEQLLRQKPEIFDRNDEAPPAGWGNYRVLDKEAYLDGMVANLLAAGLCAQRDPDDYNYEQLQVKNQNDFSETFDVLLGAGYMWHNGASYRATCVPASFPVERGNDLPPVGSGCGRPYPPPVHDVSVKVHIRYGDYDLLDSTPIVGPDAAFCSAIGYTDGRAFCPVRMEGSPERSACEAWRTGVAEDTGRPGPTWRRNGAFCSGPDSGCQNAPDNQYGLWAFQSGTYTACAANGVCGTVQDQRP